MRKFLSHDSETGELRLVYTDLWDGQHERTEYRVTDMRGGSPLRGNAFRELDGREVTGTAPDLYLPPRGRTLSTDFVPRVWTEPTAIGLTVKTPCPKAVNPRRKCALCAAETAA
jgi:hypothetical protein